MLKQQTNKVFNNVFFSLWLAFVLFQILSTQAYMGTITHLYAHKDMKTEPCTRTYTRIYCMFTVHGYIDKLILCKHKRPFF